jgi:hypothetical protein
MRGRDVQWDSLDPQLRHRIDELLCARHLFPAIVLVWQEGGVEPPLGLFEAQDLLVQRRDELDRRGLVQPEPPPPTIAQLIEAVAAVAAPVVAIEALWDGDTQAWLVRLAAIVRRPGADHDHFDEVPLTLLRDGGDIRLFNNQVPPWPEMQRATEQGQTLAQHFGVPFHFTSPATPDVNLPRWWDTQPT